MGCPTGKDWSITFDVDKNGVGHYHVLFTGAVVDNTSKHNGRPNELAKSIKSQFEQLFTVNEQKGENGAAGFIVDPKADINVYDDAQSIGYKETLFNIKDRTDDDFDGGTFGPGNIIAIALDSKQISVNEKYVGNMLNGSNTKTLAHEIGHTGGLKHPKMDYGLHWGGTNGFKNTLFPGSTAHLGKSNFMNQGDNPAPTGPTRDQMYRIYNLYSSGKLNNSSINAVEQ